MPDARGRGSDPRGSDFADGDWFLSDPELDAVRAHDLSGDAADGDDGEVLEPEFYDADVVRAVLGSRQDDRRRADLIDPDLLLARAVGALLATHRRLHRLTQAEQARRLGVDQAWISRVERGLRTPSLRTMARVARGTGSTITVRLAPGEARRPVATTTTRTPLGLGLASVTVEGPARPARRPGTDHGPWSAMQRFRP
ncbi:helix-turn-helix domain-containing protein [Patulibacter sp. S7RM1-6]